MLKEIRDRLQGVPFLPFVIYTTDGREYAVPTVDHAHVYPNGSRVSIYTDDGHHYILPALLISGIRVNEGQTAG